MATAGAVPGRAVLRRVDTTLQNPDVRFGQLAAAGALALLTFVGILYPAPAAVLFLGAILGSLSALIAMGIVLVYRANRIVNFAAGDLGAMAAVLSVSLIVGPGWPFFAALGAGLAASLVLGAAIEVLVIRRFSKAPRLILSVATIGLAAVLAYGQLALPTAFGYSTAPQDFPRPFPFSFEWFPVVFHSGHLLVLIVVPVVTVALSLFFRFTRAGTAVRASAEAADRAALLGVPVKRIGTLVWIIAAALSGIAVLLRAPIVGVSIGSVFGPTLLLRGLAAAVIAKMESLPTTFAVSLLLGVLESAVFWETGSTVVADAVLFFLILGALLFQRRGASRAEDAGASTWQVIREIRPIPGELSALPVIRFSVRAPGLTALALALFVPMSWNGSRVNLIGVGLIFGMVGVSLVILTGWAGQISLGQMAFVAAGGSVAGSLAENGWDFFVTFAVAGLVGAGAAILIGIPALRIQGLFLAVATLGFALATGSYFLNRDYFPWLVPESRVLRPVLFGKFDLESEHTYYVFLLVLLLLVLASARSLRASRTGRVLVATRDNQRAAQSFGVSPLRARLTAFAVSGFIAGIAGAAFVYHQHGLPGAAMEVEKSILVFQMVVIGGLGSLPGALIGATYQTFLDYSPLTRLPATRLLASGVGTLLILMFLPGGIGGLVYDVRDAALRRIARVRGIIVPSLLADVRTDESEAAGLDEHALADAAESASRTDAGADDMVELVGARR